MACHVGRLVGGLKPKYDKPDWIYLYNKWFVIKIVRNINVQFLIKSRTFFYTENSVEYLVV